MGERDQEHEERKLIARKEAGRELRALRQRRSMSQAELARVSGVGRMTVWRLEEGQPSSPQVSTVAKMLEAVRANSKQTQRVFLLLARAA